MTTTYTATTTTGALTIKYVYDKAQIESVLVGACHYLWDHGQGPHGTDEAPVTFEQLTVAQMEQMIDDHVRDVLINAASTYKSLAGQDAARVAAALAATTTYKLGT
jgi:hypothetical protein